MEDLKIIVNRCKYGVYISINEHRGAYETVGDFIANLMGGLESIPKDVFEKMVELDTVAQVQFYPDTPIDFYTCWHYDLDKCLHEAANIVRGLK